ncbi:MAG: PAS domain-containing sensor histidine kinase [Halobacteriota archaeon]|nr:PAS domain-containing sensor histidine kinase [Halobacteriota archaeon]
MMEEIDEKHQIMDALMVLRQKLSNFVAPDATDNYPDVIKDNLLEAMEASMDGMAISDQNDEYIYLNEAHANIYGYDGPEELIGKTWKVLYDGKVIEEIEKKVKSQLEKTGLWKGESVGTKRDGSKFFQELSIMSLNGGMTACVVRDITKRKENERALKESEEKYRKIVERANVAIIIIQDGILKFGNEMAWEMFGYVDEDIEKIDFINHLKSEFREIAKERYRDRIAGKEVSETFEIDAINKGGKHMILEVNAIKIDYKGKPADFVILNDVSDKKNIERDLKKSKKEMERAYNTLKDLDKLKTEFAAVATHEIGTPLSIVKSNIEMLLENAFGDITDLQRERLEVVLRNTEYLVKLNKEMMDISRIDAGKLKLKKESCSIHDVVEKTTQAMKPLAMDKNLNIAVMIDDNVPVINCDGERVRQVLDNLLNNAIKFTPESGYIMLNVGDDDGVVMISVSDNGLGIPEDEQNKIFDRFYEVGSYLSHETGGAGLGLAIVKGIVEAHGGKVWVESSLGSGSTFYFTLPK